jgi:hypothetical protein
MTNVLKTYWNVPKILFFFSLLSGTFIHAQEKILFLNGSEGTYSILDSTGTKIKAEYKVGNKIKKTELEKDDIFSITYNGNNEVIIYKQDSLSQENYLDVNDMRAYIAGEQDALKHFRSPFSTISSAGIGLASGFYAPTLLSPVAPALWVGFMGSRWIKIKRRHVTDSKYIREDMYVVGYGRTARSLRVQNALKAAAIGLATGLIGNFLIYGNNKLIKR